MSKLGKGSIDMCHRVTMLPAQCSIDNSCYKWKHWIKLVKIFPSSCFRFHGYYRARSGQLRYVLSESRRWWFCFRYIFGWPWGGDSGLWVQTFHDLLQQARTRYIFQHLRNSKTDVVHWLKGEQVVHIWNICFSSKSVLFKRGRP